MKIMILGMGRSGSNAIRHWICKNLGLVTCYRNCTRGWKKKRFAERKTTIEYDGEGEHSKVYTIEDFYLPLWKKYDMSNWKQEFDKVITIVRSPRNWLASSIAAPQYLKTDYKEKYLDKDARDGGNYEIPGTRIDAFMKYLKLYDLFIKRYPTDHIILNCFTINYDKWYNDDNYRMLLANAIGLKSNKKPKHCIFSSFGDNYDYTGDRYELLSDEDKKRFDDLYNDDLKYYQEKYWSNK
jgi:hypothetical protein